MYLFSHLRRGSASAQAPRHSDSKLDELVPDISTLLTVPTVQPKFKKKYHSRLLETPISQSQSGSGGRIVHEVIMYRRHSRIPYYRIRKLGVRSNTPEKMPTKPTRSKSRCDCAKENRGTRWPPQSDYPFMTFDYFKLIQILTHKSSSA